MHTYLIVANSIAEGPFAWHYMILHSASAYGSQYVLNLRKSTVNVDEWNIYQIYVIYAENQTLQEMNPFSKDNPLSFFFSFIRVLCVTTGNL